VLGHGIAAGIEAWIGYASKRNARKRCIFPGMMTTKCTKPDYAGPQQA
jgi:hypothetical protein